MDKHEAKIRKYEIYFQEQETLFLKDQAQFKHEVELKARKALFQESVAFIKRMREYDAQLQNWRDQETKNLKANTAGLRKWKDDLLRIVAEKRLDGERFVLYINQAKV